jgi:hypothetical protein
VNFNVHYYKCLIFLFPHPLQSTFVTAP